MRPQAGLCWHLIDWGWLFMSPWSSVARIQYVARRVRPSRPASACLSSTFRLNLVLTQGIPPDFRGGVHLFIPPYVIGSVPRSSGHAFAYVPMAFTAESPPAQGLSPQDSSSNGCSLFFRYHDGLIFERLSFPTP